MIKLPQSSLRDARFPFLSLRDIFPRPGEVVLGDGAFGKEVKFAFSPEAPSQRELSKPSGFD